MPNRAGTVRKAIFAILLLILGGMIGYQIGGGKFQTTLSEVKEKVRQVKLTKTEQPSDFSEVQFAQFWQVWRVLEENYLDPDKIQNDKMVYGAIQGMTSSLGDPYTVYLPPQEQKRSEEDLQGSFFGVGIQLGYVDNVLAVMSPLKGTPAEEAGVKAKDLIIHVKDEKIDKDTQGWSLSEAVDNIRGEKGTKVTLTLLRRDEKPEPFTVTLERKEILVPSAEVKFIDQNGKKLAHIQLSRFGERTTAELNGVIAQIAAQSPKVSGIILDMRNNPGGLLDGAVSVSSEFIKNGVVVTQKGKTTSKDYLANGSGRLADYPVIVVVNGGSASAAEIVAGAIRDRRDAELVGEKTFGKGTVQDAMRLDNGAGLHVTIARWLLPKGSWIHETGIPVTIEVKDDPKTTDVDEVIVKAAQDLTK